MTRLSGWKQRSWPEKNTHQNANGTKIGMLVIAGVFDNIMNKDTKGNHSSPSEDSLLQSKISRPLGLQVRVPSSVLIKLILGGKKN